MERRYVLFLVLGLQVCITALAQKNWSAKDSLWLQRVLSGQEKLKLNEETLRAIRSGTLINPTLTPDQTKHSPLELPIVKSFDSIIQPESHRALHLLPPYVFNPNYAIHCSAFTINNGRMNVRQGSRQAYSPPPRCDAFFPNTSHWAE